MRSTNKTALSTAIIVALLAGCSTTTATNKEELHSPEENAYLNQGQVDELVAVEVPQQKQSKSVASKSSQPYSKKPAQNSASITTPPAIEAQVKTSSYDHQPNSAPAVTAVQRVDSTSLNLSKSQTIQPGIVLGNWATKPSHRVVRPFNTKKGDTYKDTISRWLMMEGYKSSIYVLSDEVDSVLDKSISSSLTYYGTLPTALNELGSEASKTGANYKTVLPKDLRLYISLNKATQTATVYSINNALEIHHEGNPVETKLVEPEQSYQVFKGETYEHALYRWIGDVGYHKFGKLVSKDAEKVLSQKVTNNDVINEEFSKAATLLLLQAVEQAKNSDRNERDGFISELGKDDLELHLFLNDLKHEAILTSSNQPVTMFTVSKGSLKDNFHRLSAAFGWNKHVENPDDHFMAQDYEIDFSYPIVSEKGNIQRALTELLDGFPKLRGAIVPPTRTAYVVKED